MSKTALRITAILLVMLLICGMFPTVFATDTASEDIVTEELESAANSSVSSIEEPVTATPVILTHNDTESAPMLMSAGNAVMRAATNNVSGTHYHRGIVWLTSGEKVSYTYKGKDYNVDHLYVHGVITNGQRYVAYCIDPGIDTTQSSGGYTGSETAWTDLDINTQTAVGLAVLYGAPNKLQSSDKKTQFTYEFATQMIIHEIVLGYRSNIHPYACTDSRLIDRMTYGNSSYFREITSGSVDYSSIHGKHMDKTVLKEAYDTISASLANHYVLPSFASRYNAAAKTYEMAKQSDGTYAVTLTDANGILSNCTFQNGNGLTYAVNGNKLTIKASTTFDGTKSCALSGGTGVSKQVPNLESETFMLWQSGNYQRIVSLQEPVNDPLPLYLNVKIPIQNGSAKIVKTTTNGGTVAGWHFAIKDAKGNAVGSYTTDSSGVITVELAAGTYTVTETDGAYKYWVNDPNPTRTVTVKAGETTTVTYQNQWKGQAQIVKTATNGGSVAGWHFTVKNSSGEVIGNYVTDTAGIITLDLDPGTYTVTETDGAYAYWHNDPTPTKTVTVKAGETAQVTFQNQWIGKVKIIKTLANPEAGSLEGWTFTIKDSSGKKIGTYQTDNSGTIATDLEPGIYTIAEELDADSLWQYTTTNPQTITVKAGTTAEVTFTNALRPAKVLVQKVDERGNPLAGAEFLLQWSTDGENWSNVSYSDSTIPKIGYCSTTGLVDGKLITGDSGLVEFSGLYPTLYYRLTETKAPDGYLLLSAPVFTGILSSDQDLTLGFTVTNVPVFKLPETGSNTLFLTIPGIALCYIACVGVICLLRKKEV